MNASAFAQDKTISLSFRPMANNKAIALYDTFDIDANEHVILETLRFYISGIELCQGNSPVWKEKGSVHLYDLEDPKNILLSVPSSLVYDHIRFCIGIDSLTNVSGAMGGALDPMLGMYWTWQSGYINFKAEGHSSASAHPKKEFQLHLGGYSGSDKALRQISLPLVSSSAIGIRVDLRKFLEAAALAKRPHLMSPCPEAVELSDVLSHCFKIGT